MAYSGTPEEKRRKGAEQMRRWRAAHRKAAQKYGREYARKWRAANPGKNAEALQRRYWANPEKWREYARRWRELYG